MRRRGTSPPADLAPHDKRLWLDVQRHLREQGTWADTDEPLLEHYVRSIVLARLARAAAAGRPFVEGSRGQLVPHPGLKVAADAEAAACRYAGALLLTAEARKRHELGRVDGPRDDDLFPFAEVVGCDRTATFAVFCRVPRARARALPARDQ